MNGDERTVRLLEEIRDLQREQAARQAEMFALQQRAVENQFASVEVQGQAVAMQRTILKRLMPALTVIVLAVIALALLWLWLNV
jgi:type VI protein secretion system component VasF